jgi:quinol monooxygenase YgiN
MFSTAWLIAGALWDGGLPTASPQLAGSTRQPEGRRMLTIAAVIRARPGTADTMRQALLDVAGHVQANEPDTIGFFVSQDAADPHVFVTYERFVDRAAMDRHNNSAVVARVFSTAKPPLDGPVTLLTCNEVAAMAR